MVQLKAAEGQAEYQVVSGAFQGNEMPYDTETSRAALIAQLRAKHGLSAD